MHLKSEEHIYGKTGEQEFSAPEMYQGSLYSNKVDIWSIGTILYYLLTSGKKLRIDPETLE